MGRPLNKRYFGNPETPDQRAAGTETQNNIRVECNTGNGAVDTGYIVAQKGSAKFRVTDGTTVLNCFMVNKATAALAEGEMVMFGTDGATGTRVPLKKITARKAVDYNNNQYTWSVQDDSTESVLVLIAL